MTNSEYVTIIYSYMNTFLKRIVEEYSPIDYKINRGDIGQRIPVWVFWWQGIDEMPEMVRLCVASMKKNLPAEYIDIHVLDKNNYTDFIQLPSIVSEKLNDEVITIAHFSDVLRSALLYRYGGWWIDSTIFVGRKIDKDFFYNNSFFTQKYGFKVEAPYPDPAEGRWATYLLKSPANMPLFKFIYDSWLFYLDRHDQVLDYYLTDYMIAIAYDSFVWAKESIDSVPPNNLHTGDLMAFYGNQEYDPEWMDTLTRDTQFFKMSYKAELSHFTPEGMETTYGALCRLLLDARI